MFEYNFRKVQYNYIFEIGGWMTRVKKKKGRSQWANSKH